MDTDVVSVHPDVKATDVASTIARYDCWPVPVLDDERQDARHRHRRRRDRRDHPGEARELLPRFTRHLTRTESARPGTAWPEHAGDDA